MSFTKADKRKLEALKEKERLDKKEQAKEQRKFKDMCRQKFGYNPTEIADIIKEKEEFETDGEIRTMMDLACDIIAYYELKSNSDVKKWVDIMLNENSKEYWSRRRFE